MGIPGSGAPEGSQTPPQTGGKRQFRGVWDPFSGPEKWHAGTRKWGPRVQLSHTEKQSLAPLFLGPGLPESPPNKGAHECFGGCSNYVIFWTLFCTDFQKKSKKVEKEGPVSVMSLRTCPGQKCTTALKKWSIGGGQFQGSERGSEPF